jgi:3-hydroxypropanoate dehydrogenase
MSPSPRLIPLQSERPALGLDRLLRPSSEAVPLAPRALPHELLAELQALMAVGPGMTGSSSTRMEIVTSAADRARLAEALDLASQAAALEAPACTVIAYDREFSEQMLAFAAEDLDGRSCFDDSARLQAAVLRNSLLQGAYLAVSARALGLELNFLQGFDAAGLAADLFSEPGLEVIFIATLGFPADGGA